MSDDEKRVAQIFGVAEDEELPDVSENTLEIYHGYLGENLSFPFDAEYSQETGPLEDTHYDFQATGLLDLDECPDLEFYGLFCEGKRERRRVVVPLAEVEVKQRGKNRQLIEDYSMWFWNYR
jgi:hypothetical protein